MKVSRTAAMETLHIRIHFLLLLTVAAAIVQSKSNVAIQDTYQKLEKSLIQNRIVLRQMQETFFSSQNLPPDSVRLNVCVTVGSVQPGNCDNSFSPGGEGKFSYCQKFQWSRSVLLNLIRWSVRQCHNWAYQSLHRASGSVKSSTSNWHSSLWCYSGWYSGSSDANPPLGKYIYTCWINDFSSPPPNCHTNVVVYTSIYCLIYLCSEVIRKGPWSSK